MVKTTNSSEFDIQSKVHKIYNEIIGTSTVRRFDTSLVMVVSSYKHRHRSIRVSAEAISTSFDVCRRTYPYRYRT